MQVKNLLYSERNSEVDPCQGTIHLSVIIVGIIAVFAPRGLAGMARSACVLVVVSIRALSDTRDTHPRLLYLRICTLHRQGRHLLQHLLPVRLISPSLQQF
jgi:hypothetical protein